MAARNPAAKARRRTTDVETYMGELEYPCKKEMQAPRRIIFGGDPQISEEIKWNTPGFALGEHFVTFNGWATNYVELIFHHRPKKATSKGIPIEDPDGLLAWLATDRASVRSDSMKDVSAKKSGLQKIVRLWIRAMPPAP